MFNSGDRTTKELGFSGHPQLEAALFVAVSAIYFATLSWNLSILAPACLDSCLHTLMYFSLSNLASLNICYTSLVVPKMLFNFLVARKSISYRLCSAQVSVTLSLGVAECLLLVVMAFGRYVAICHLLRYSTMMNKNICVSLATRAWGAGRFLGSVVPSLMLKQPVCGFIIGHLFCEAPILFQLAWPGEDLSENAVVVAAGSVFTLPLPSALIRLSYVRIVAAILRIPSAAGKRKAFSTCSAHVTVVTVCYGSGMFTYMRPPASASAEKDKLISLFYPVINPMLNPIIYTA